ncbi:MAG: GspH/FimT family pseudopilin [Planctomycetota bacterium]
MRSQRQGVSFLEVTLVVMFIGILAAVGTPYFAKAARVRATRNAAFQIADYIRYARSVAINEGRLITVTIDPDSDTFLCPDVDFPDRIGTVLSVPIKQVHNPGLELTASFDSAFSFQFDFEGSVLANGVPMNSGTITVWSPDAAQTIVIDTGTGTTTIANGSIGSSTTTNGSADSDTQSTGGGA